MKNKCGNVINMRIIKIKKIPNKINSTPQIKASWVSTVVELIREKEEATRPKKRNAYKSMPFFSQLWSVDMSIHIYFYS